MLVSLELAPSVPHVAIGITSISIRLQSHNTAYQNHFMALAIIVPCTRFLLRPIQANVADAGSGKADHARSDRMQGSP